MASSCGSTLDSVVVVVVSVSSFVSSCSSFSGSSSFFLRFLLSIILSSLWNFSIISLNLSPSTLLASCSFFSRPLFIAPKAFPASIPPVARTPAPKAILPPTAAIPITAGAALNAIANNPTFAIFFIRPLKNPPLLLGLAFAIFSIKSTIIPLASFKNSKFFCRDPFNPPKPEAKLFNEFNPPSNIFPRRALGSNSFTFEVTDLASLGTRV